MRTDPGKVFGIAVLFAATLLTMVGTILVTGFSVLDTDPASYIIVVILMLFVFMLFSLKEDLHLNKNKRIIALGVLVFVFYILLLSYARVGLSFVFATFRIDALLIPLALVSFILLLFGTYGLRKLAPLLIYSLFLSPLLLMPVLLQNSAFANVNAAFVYETLKSFGVPVTLHGITITSAANASISIASTCAPIGTFIALVMFLVPVAYLYRGSLKRKALWLISGLALVFVLNFARMFAIAYSWAYYGIDQAISIFHVFAGQILFYAAIIVMLLLAGKYGLGITRMRKGQFGELSRDFAKARGKFGMAWTYAIILGVVGLLFSLPYLNSTYASPTFFYGNLNTIGQNTIYHAIGATFTDFSANTIKVSSQNFTEALAILNGSNASNATYIVAAATNIPIPGFVVTNYTHVQGGQSYLLRNGIRLTSSLGHSGNYIFDINYFAAPFNISGQYFSVNYEFFKLINSSVPSCGLLTYRSVGLFNYIESLIYNAVSGRFNYGKNDVMCSSYTVASYV
jgi:exosortase/archaeosortase family protein